MTDKGPDTDIGFDSNVKFKTPVALQKKKKKAPVIQSSMSDSEDERSVSDINLKVDKKKKRSKAQPHNATQV